jgi:universal stress protein family protein
VPVVPGVAVVSGVPTVPAVERAEPQATFRADQAGARPVMLATLDVPFAADAVAFALDSAVELGQRLVVANFVERAPLPLSAMLGYEDLPAPPAMARSLDEAVGLARSLGVEVIRLRVRSMHPIPALLEVVAEQDPGLLVFGPDRKRIPRLRYWRATRAIRSSVTALIWLPELRWAAYRPCALWAGPGDQAVP